MRNSPSAERRTVPARLLASASARYQLPQVWQQESVTRISPALLAPAEESIDELPAESAETAITRVEAVLLLAREPLSSRKLAQFASLADGTRARTLVRALNRRYDESGTAFRVEEVAGGFQLLTRRKFASWLRRLGHVPSEVRLSPPALETLAVIAYRQPVPRADIEAIRGVSCGEILRQLMERDLVKIGGRSEDLGRPFLYCTTKRFLQVFGLLTIDDLPRADLMRSLPVASAAPPPLETAAEAALEDESSDESDDLDDENHEEQSPAPLGDSTELEYTNDET